MKNSEAQPPKIFKYWNILKPNPHKYWSIKIFSSPTSKNIEVLKYSQSQPPKILNYWNILKPNLQARQRRRRSFRRKLTLSWSLWNILIVIVLVAMKYFEHHCFFLNFSHRSVRLWVSDMSKRAWFRTFSPGFVLMIRKP